MKRTLPFLLSAFVFFSCGAPTPQAVQTETIGVYAASAAQPWMNEVFGCANSLSLLLNVSAENPDIYLRVGEPGSLVFPAYQIGEEEIAVVVHGESPIQNLTFEEAQALFAGQGDESAQVWVYASGEDVQGVFDQFVMKGRSVASFARVASDPQEMSDALNSESNAVGILPKRWVTGNIRAVFSAGAAPVLAVLKEQPQGTLKALLACLQDQ